MSIALLPYFHPYILPDGIVGQRVFTRRNRGDQHVIPLDGRHTCSPSCWCGPVVDCENPLTLNRVYVHHRREATGN